jgi:hypothetical protein
MNNSNKEMESFGNGNDHTDEPEEVKFFSFDPF